MAGHSLLTQHRSEFGEWETCARDPHPRLAPYVRRVTGWVERTTFARRRELPNPGAVLIINLDNRLNVSDPGAPERLNSYHSFFAGINNTFVVTESTGIAGGIQVDFTPIGSYLFTGISASELANKVVHLEDVLGREGRTLTDRLEATPDWETRFDLVEKVLFGRMARAPIASEGVAWAWARLEAGFGLVPISELSTELQWAPRQLIDGFRREVGLPPKQVARIVRFNRAVELLKPECGASLAQVALDCGYYDQAHFCREFREFAGSTPSEYFQRVIPGSGGVLDEDPGVGVPAISYKSDSGHRYELMSARQSG